MGHTSRSPASIGSAGLLVLAAAFLLAAIGCSSEPRRATSDSASAAVANPTGTDAPTNTVRAPDPAPRSPAIGKLEAEIPVILPIDRGGTEPEADPDTREVLAVFIEVVEEGTRIPRDPDDPAKGSYVVGHEVAWDVDGRRITDAESLREYLVTVAGDPSRRVSDGTGSAAANLLLPVVIWPRPGSLYIDVATTVDAVRAAGFSEIGFDGHRDDAPGTRSDVR
jgi:hypothetical protein